MSFAAECLGETIVYDKDSDSLTIRNLPAPLKLRLIKHMQQLTAAKVE
jgi:nucleoid-associated protein